MTQVQWIKRVVKPIGFVACLAPFVVLVHDALTGGLSANPIEDITNRTGTTTLVMLLLTLGVTPVKRLTGMGALITLRRMLGLFAFFYVTLHFATYLVLDQFFAWHFIVEDIGKRPYITVGFASFLMLIPLALTSTKGWVKRLGGRRWNRLHRLVYVAAAGGVIHFLWLVKADTREPIWFGTVLVLLLVARLDWWDKRRAPARVPSRKGASVSRAPADRPQEMPAADPAPSSQSQVS
jgi:methionine sulfoxide reductase heme-binding subunit